MAASFSTSTKKDENVKLKHWLRIAGLCLLPALVVYFILRLLPFAAPVAAGLSLVVGVGVLVAILWGLASHMFRK